MNDLASVYAGWLAFVAVQRIVELFWSHRNIHTGERREHARVAGSALDWIAMVSAHIALVVFPAFEFFVLRRADAPTRWIFWSCLVAFGCAQALRYWALHTLGRAWNARALVDPALGFVARGPYRWIRHPNYLAVLIEFSSIPLAVGAWRSWFLLNVFHTLVLVRRIRAEESLLNAIPGYEAAMGDKPRLIPKFQARRM